MDELTQEEKELKQRVNKFSEYLINYMAEYVDKESVDRRTLIGALFNMCYLTFNLHSPGSFEEKCREINSFCDYLKKQIAANLNINQEELHEFK